MDRYLSPPPTSCVAVCVWIPLFALRCEEARRPELASQPSALLAPDASRRVVWQVSPLARHAGVRPGMTVSQAIGLCPALRLCEPDPVHYDERFALLLAALARVSPVVEPAELGLAYVGTDGLEGLYGGPERQVEFVIRVLNAECGVRSAEFDVRPSMPHAALNTPHSAFRTPYFRVGWGQGKFLAAQPVAVLPLDPDAHRRLRQLGLRTLGRLAALPEEAIVSQFGRAGRRWWRLAAGATAEPVVGRVLPEPISVSLTFFTPVADREMLVLALERLIERALRHPRRTGWRVQAVRARAELERAASWLAAATLKDPSADRDHIAAPLKTRLAQTPPAGAVERLVVEFTAFAPGTAELQLFARDAGAAARAGQRRALRSAVQEITLRLKRPMLHHVIEVQPWSSLPERRYALIDYEP